LESEEDNSTFDIAEDIHSKHKRQVIKALCLMNTQKLNFDQKIDHWKKTDS
jgi:hypothetical protein